MIAAAPIALIAVLCALFAPEPADPAPEPAPEPTAPSPDLGTIAPEDMPPPRPKRGEPKEAAPPPRPPPRPEPEPKRERKPLVPVRRGVLVAAGIGFAGCGRLWCEVQRGGFGSHIEAGYRFGVLSLLAGGDLGVARARSVPGLPALHGSVRSTNVGAGLGIHPARKKPRRLDPMFGAKLVYNRTRLGGTVSGIEFEETVSRGGVRLFGGMLVHLSNMVRVGPRFDVTIPFAGEICLTARLPEELIDECSTIREQREVGFATQELPIHWDILLDVQVVIPIRRAAKAPSEQGRRGSGERRM